MARDNSSNSWWDKADIVLRGALIPVVVALVGYFGSSYLAQREQVSSAANFYTDLVTKREEADSSLRQAMFKSVIDSFLGKFAEDKEKEVLGLELLAYNFNDSLELGPLFKDVYLKTLRYRGPARIRQDLIERLKKVATEVTTKQVAALAEAGEKWDAPVDFRELSKDPSGSVTVLDEPLPVPLNRSKDASEPKQRLKLEVLEVNREREELKVRLEVRSLSKAAVRDATFWVSHFDFPMLDNTRLAGGQRCAVVLQQFDQDSAQITVVYFPGSRSSLKEKAYYDELIDDYRRKALRSLNGSSTL